MITLFMHLFIIYMLPWIFLGLVIIAVICVLVSDIYENRLRNYVHQHTGWRPDKDDR